MAPEPPPPWIRRRSRELRLWLVWTAVAFTVVVFIPAALTGIFLLFRFDQCAAVFCNRGFRSFVAITAVAILLPIVLAWMRFLQRIQSYRDANDATDE
jgi:hypothetical protein